MNEIPEWQKFIAEDDARLKAQKAEEANFRVGMESVAGKTVTPEVESQPESRYEPLYEDFRMLPESFQEEIIREITDTRSRGSDAKDLILRTLTLTRAYREFIKTDSGEKPDDPEKEKWESELGEILEELKKIKSERREEKPQPPEAPKSERVN